MKKIPVLIQRICDQVKKEKSGINGWRKHLEKNGFELPNGFGLYKIELWIKPRTSYVVKIRSSNYCYMIGGSSKFPGVVKEPEIDVHKIGIHSVRVQRKVQIHPTKDRKYMAWYRKHNRLRKNHDFHSGNTGRYKMKGKWIYCMIDW